MHHTHKKVLSFVPIKRNCPLYREWRQRCSREERRARRSAAIEANRQREAEHQLQRQKIQAEQQLLSAEVSTRDSLHTPVRVYILAALILIFPRKISAMSDTTDLYGASLRFVLDSRAPAEYRRRWKDLKEICEDGRLNNEDLINEWIAVLKKHDFGQAIDRQRLMRMEGGIGGDCNVANRQLRIYCGSMYRFARNANEDIMINAFDSSDRKSVWRRRDLDEFGAAFKHVLDVNMDEECVSVHIDIPLSLEINA